MKLQEQLKEATTEALAELGQKGVVPHFEHPENPEHGDYSTNLAMKIGDKPLENAKKLANRLAKSSKLTKLVEKVEVAEPGFINFWLSKRVLSQELSLVLKQGEGYGGSDLGSKKTIVVEYSSPNIAKRFGIGHLRSTIIGQAIYNLYSFLGYKMIDENHLGDWGTQFGMLLHQIASKELEASKLSIEELEKLYIEFNREAAKKPELMQQARDWFKKLEDGDQKARSIWKAVKETSIKEFNRLYQLLGVSFENMHGESFYQDKMPQVIKEAKDKGVASKDKGALIIRVPGIKTPLILVKSDGATTYETRDLAAVKWRIKTWKPDLIVYEVGAEQDLHFRLVFGATQLLGYADLRQFVHVKHGLYRSAGGKIGTRLGKSVRLEEVLEEAIKRARRIIEKSETSRGLGLQEKKEVARAVGVGSVKYFDLMHRPATDIVFDWEKIFLLEGNSAPYLQYTYARTQSVLAKAKSQKPKAGNNLKLEPEELAVLRTFYKFPEVVQEAALSFSPNLVCNFLFDLATKYNNLYNSLPILKPQGASKDRERVRNFRLGLTAVTGQVLKNGLLLLGITAPKRM